MTEPLGPDSLMWRYFGDWRGLLLALWAGSMQNMHPQLGAGVEEHSEFFDERWERLYRSLYPIGGVVYDGPRAEETAKLVRGFHNGIKGVDARGRPYHALNPETFFWAHATFLVMPILINDRLGKPLTEEQKAQVYAEGVQWYRLYGMSMRPVPPDWPSFQRYWDHMCRDVLEVNKATLDVRDLSRIGRPPLMRWLPEPAWRWVRPPTARLMHWLTTGCYDPPIREKLGLRWTRRDEVLLTVVGRIFAAVWSLVPFKLRFHPRARAAWNRAEGRLPADAPLVETPPRNYPPPDKRDDPKHYFPGQRHLTG